MLNWLDRFWNNVRGKVGNGIADAVHYAEHAIMAVVLSMFTAIQIAISIWQRATAAVSSALTEFMGAVHQFVTWVTAVAIPALSRWVQAGLTELKNGILSLAKSAYGLIVKLGAQIVKAYQDLSSWVLRNVWDPLTARIKQLENNLLKWGYTAWWYITHPAALADLLILDIARSAEKRAWTLAGMLGKFTLSLVVRNLPKLIALVEDIVTAVL